MTRRKQPVVLAKLAEDSRGELRAMTAELVGPKFKSESAAAAPIEWGRRFAASGKIFVTE